MNRRLVGKAMPQGYAALSSGWARTVLGGPFPGQLAWTSLQLDVSAPRSVALPPGSQGKGDRSRVPGGPIRRSVSSQCP